MQERASTAPVVVPFAYRVSLAELTCWSLVVRQPAPSASRVRVRAPAGLARSLCRGRTLRDGAVCMRLPCDEQSDNTIHCACV